MSLHSIPLAIWLGDTWYLLPLIVSISLVYAGTRHELMSNILSHALRVGLWIGGVMAVIFAILAYVTQRL
jgi:hypothetical protein